MDEKEFWKRVNKRIKELNITQEALCKDLGINLGTLRQQITHSRYPSVDIAFRFAQALGVSVEYLVTGTESDKKSELIDEIKSLINRYS